MRINFQTIKTWPVETESGKLLGHIEDVEWEAETNHLQRIIVIERKLLVEKNKFLISIDQVIRFEEGKIIVQDNIEREFRKGTIRKPVPANEQTPVQAERD